MSGPGYFPGAGTEGLARHGDSLHVACGIGAFCGLDVLWIGWRVHLFQVEPIPHLDNQVSGRTWPWSPLSQGRGSCFRCYAQRKPVVSKNPLSSR